MSKKLAEGSMFRTVGLPGIVVFVGIISCFAGARAQQGEFELLPDLLSKNLTPYCSGFAGEQRDPDIASDGKGNTVVVWEDSRNGYWDVYMQCYSSGKRVGSNQKVNRAPAWTRGQAGSQDRAWPVVDVNTAGAGVIVWRQNRGELRACMFDIVAASIGNEMTVYAGAEESWIGMPSVEVFSDGSFIIGWSSDDHPVMQYRRLSPSGSALSEPSILPGYGLTEKHGTPLHSCPDDRTAAVLSSDYTDSAAVFLAFIDGDGEQRTERMEVFPPDPNIWDHFYNAPASAMNGLGHMLVARMAGVTDTGNGRRFIQWRVVDCISRTATPIQMMEVGYGQDLQALADTGSGFQLYWVDPDPEFAIARVDTNGIMFDLTRFDHTMQGPARWQIGEPCFLHDGVQGLLAVWTVESSESFTGRSTQLRLTRMDHGAAAIVDHGPISDDVCGASEEHPVVFSNGAGRFLACWQAAPAGINLLHCQVVDERLDAVGPVLIPNIETETEFSGILDAAVTPDGGFLLVHRSAGQRGRGVLYLDRIGADGNAQGQSVRLDDTTYTSMPVAIACSQNGIVTVGYHDVGEDGWGVQLVRLSWSESAHPSTAARDSWPIVLHGESTRQTIVALDVSTAGDVLHAAYEFVFDGGLRIKDLRGVMYSTAARADTVLLLPMSAVLIGANDWYLLRCAIDADQNVAVAWTERRSFGDRCSEPDQWYDEPSLQVLRAHAEAAWRPHMESFPLRYEDIPAVTLQWPESGELLCTWSVADSCKAVKYDDASQARASMAFHLSSPSEQPALDDHRSHSAVMDGKHVVFLFESNDESGHGYDIHGKVLAFGEAGGNGQQAFSFDLFPAPANRQITARFVLPERSRVVLRIYDLIGRLLRTRDAGVLDEGGHFLALPVDGLAAGNYLVELSTPEPHFRSMLLLH